MSVLYESALLRVETTPEHRLHLRKRDHGMMCNVSVQRIVDAALHLDEHGAAWLALHGCMARVDFARHIGNTGLVGPFPEAEIVAMVHALREQLALPRLPMHVECTRLESDPRRWTEHLLESEGTLSNEGTTFARAFLLWSEGLSPHGNKAQRVRLVGYWRCSGETDFDDNLIGHGPVRLHPAEFEVLSIQPV